MKKPKKVKGISPEGKKTNFANKAYIEAKKAEINKTNQPKIENMLRNSPASTHNRNS